MKRLFISIIFSFLFISIQFAQDNTYLIFNGYSSGIEVPFSPSLRSADKMTLTAWIQTYSTGGDWQALMWCGSYYENHYAFKITPDNRVRGLIWIGGPVTIFSETVLEPNKWYHIAFTYDSNILTDNNYKLYINGMPEAQTHMYGLIGEDSNSMVMGVYPGLWNQYFKGAMRDVQFWSRALSQQEIQNNMNAVLDPQQETGLKAYWRFSEGEGNILYDHSGNGNHGVISNCEWFPPQTNLKAKITLDTTFWKDSDYNGFEARSVSGSESIGEIKSYTWTLNGDTISTSIAPVIEAPTGSNMLKLMIRDADEALSSDSVRIDVYCAELITNGAIRSAPSLLNDSSLFISSLDDKVYNFDSTGNAKWTFLTGGDIRSTAAVLDKDNIFVTSEDTRLYSFNNEGIPNWDKAMGGVIISTPAVSLNEKTIYTGLNSGRMFAVSLKNEVLWSFQAGGAIISSAVIGTDGNIYFGSQDKYLYALNKHGNFKWKFLADSELWSSPAITRDSSILIVSGYGILYKINHAGEQVWMVNLLEEVPNESHWPFFNSPVIDQDGNIYVGSLNGWFYSFTKDGGLNWKYRTSGAIYSTASISPDGKVIYFGTVGCEIIAITSDGNLKWKLKTESYVYAPTMVTSNNIVYAGDNSGKVYIIKDIPYEQTTKLPELQWPTFQGNNQRTGERSSILTYVDNKDPMPENYSLQNYPNPFNPSTRISYSIVAEAKVQIRIYNSLGEIVRTFEPELKSAGSYQVQWSAGVNASGIYFCTINAVPVNGGGPFNKTIKMMLMK